MGRSSKPAPASASGSPTLLQDVICDLTSDRALFAANRPCPTLYEPGAPRLAVVSGENAGGKSLFARAVAALLRWLAARVDDMSKRPGDSSRDQVDAPPVTVTRPLQLARVIAGMLPAERLALGRAHITRAIERARRHDVRGRLPTPWRLAGAAPQPDWPGAILRLSSPDGGELELTLSVQPDRDKPAVSVGARVGDDTDPASAGACMQAMRALLAG